MSGDPGRGEVLDALFLAFDHSGLRGPLSSEAFGALVEGLGEALFDGQTLDLAVLSEELETAAQVHPQQSDPLLCRLKAWERALGVEVRLPERLEALSDFDRQQQAAYCQAPTQKLRTLLRPPDPSSKESARPEAERRRTKSGPRLRRSRRGAPPRPLLVALAGGAAAVFLVAGFLLWRGLNPAVEFQELSASLGDIPAERLLRRGPEAGATLTDPSWLDLPRQARRSDLERALERLRANDVEVLFLRDPEGRIRATAQWHESGSGERVVVRFP